MSQPARKIVVVGAGLTGSLLHHLLRKTAPELTVQIWEKAEGPGGRYNTTSPSSITTHKPHVDLGAQYVTAFEPEAHGHYYQALVDGGVLLDIKPELIHGGRGSHMEQKHWSVPSGISSVPGFFLSGAAVEFQRELRSLNIVDGSSWILTDQNGKEERADAVVLTGHIPDVMGIEGNVQDALLPYKSDLEKVSYSSRFAMGIHYPAEAWTALESVPWVGKYFTPSDSDVIVWISINGLDHAGDAPRAAVQSGQEIKEGPTILVHTTVPFGLKNGGAEHDEVQATIMSHVNKLLPELVELAPVEMQLLYWKCSQVYKGYKHDQEMRPAALAVTQTPPLFLAGDAFTKSGFDGCIDSAEAASAMITQTTAESAFASTAGVEQQCVKAAM